MKRQRSGAYAVVHRMDHVLLSRMSARTPTPGRWTLPGGGVQHGEDPTRTVLRELYEETGVTGSVDSLLGVHSNVYLGPTSGDQIHGVRLIFAVHPETGTVRAEAAGSTDGARWVSLGELAHLELSDHARYALTELCRDLQSTVE